MSGLRLAALYSLFPHKLGFCGPHKKSATQALLNYLYPHTKDSGVGVSGKKVSEKKIRKILKGFKGAFFYYKLIAKCNNIKDPFDKKVIKAYWVGNKLLEKVGIEDLRQMVIRDFSKPGLLPKKIALKKAKEIPDNSKPHHSFHVLIMGPVMRRILLKGKLLDLCRVSWGKVMKKYKIQNAKCKIIVNYQPLVGDKILKLGKPIQKEIFWDKTLVPEIKIGDWISFHWNNVVQKLKKEDIDNIKRYTKITLRMLAKTK